MHFIKDNSDQQLSVDDKYLRDMLCQLEKEGEVYYKDSNKDNYKVYFVCSECSLPEAVFSVRLPVDTRMQGRLF